MKFSDIFGEDPDDFIAHEGKAHDENPPGRGSGRYAFGSGKDVYQHNPFMREYTQYQRKGMSEREIASAMGFRTMSEFKGRISYEKGEDRKAKISAACALVAEKGNQSEVARMFGVNESTLRGWMEQNKRGLSQTKTDTVIKVLKDQVDKKAKEDKEHGGPGLGLIDVSPYTELQPSLDCTQSRLNTALSAMKDQGYKVSTLRVPRANDPKNKLIVSVLSKADVPYQTIKENMNRVRTIDDEWIDTDTLTARMLKPPVSMSSKNVMIRYKDMDDGNGHKGIERDGCIEIRPGADYLSLGKNKFAQVRIAVDDTHYLKGMAVYGDPKEFPKGVDVIFNTNKSEGTPMCGPKNNSVLKPLKKDPVTGEVDKDNPFGATIKIGGQRWYTDKKTGKEKQSPINIVNDDEDWAKWSKSLPSQFLGKQQPALAQKQLNISYQTKKTELDQIKAIESPAVKKHLLEEFASSCDTAANDLKAAPLPHQATHVILPIPSLNDKECFCPDYPDGTYLALVRYPHAGRFEIPIVRVNNSNAEGKRVITNDNRGVAIGINSHVASQLSGADFDGDTVVCLPTNHGEIKNRKPFDALKNFDPASEYALPPGKKPITADEKQKQMGIVSNLITDMTLQGADDDELVRAVRHSMVVIDAEKHNYDYKKSEKDNDIEDLKRKYQKKMPGTYKKKDYGGAATLLSRAGSTYYGIGDRKNVSWQITDEYGNPKTDKNGKILRRDPKSYAVVGNYTVDPKTGKKLYDYSPKAQYDKGVKVNVLGEDGKPLKIKGKNVKEQLYDENGNRITEKADKGWRSTQMAEIDDAKNLMSGPHHEGTQMERIYANYANNVKRLAEEARKEYVATGSAKKDSKAAEQYKDEVDSLNAKLRTVEINRPKSRRAEMIAAKNAARIIQDNPELKYDEEGQQKVRRQCINVARVRTGASTMYKQVVITPKEYEAIKANAMSESQLKTLFTKVDDKSLKEAAIPRQQKIMTPAKVASAKGMIENGYTLAQVAEMLGVSTSTLSKSINGKD